MKKLISVIFMLFISLLVRAEGGADTSFEDLAIGELPIADDSYWSTNGVEGSVFEVFDATTTNGFESYGTVSRPDKYTVGENKQALFINTVDPIFRKVDSAEVDASGKPAISLKESPLYFDSIVQFETDYVSPDVSWRSDIQEYTDKIIVWLYGSPSSVSEDNPGLFGETAPFTNLVITAGKYLYDGYNNMVNPSNYLTNIEVKPNEWHRLTIKAINNIAKAGEQHTPGFEVWFDEVKVEATLDYVNRDPSNMITTFPSIATRDFTGNNKITGIAFDGVGAVDDIVFTTTAPAFDPPEEEPVQPTIETYAINTSGEHAAFALCEDDTWSEELDKNAIKTTLSDLYVIVYPEENYELDSARFNGNDVSPFLTGPGHYIFSISVPKNDSGVVNKGETFNFTVEMKKKEAGAPMINGALAESPEAFIENANSGVEIQLPENWTLNGNTLIDSNGEEYATFPDYYDVSLVGGIIELVLNDTVKPVIGETALGKGDAIIVTDTAVIVGVTNARAGLYYGVQAYSEPAATAADELGDASGWIKAEGETVNVTIDKPKDSNGEYIDPAFFRAVVTDVEPTP